MCSYKKESDVKERTSFAQCELSDLWQTPVVAQFSSPRWMAAPHRPEMPNLIDKVRPVTDDIVGWPDELATDFFEYLLSWTTPRPTPPD
jgi:hypothetical protein